MTEEELDRIEKLAQDAQPFPERVYRDQKTWDFLVAAKDIVLMLVGEIRRLQDEQDSSGKGLARASGVD